MRNIFLKTYHKLFSINEIEESKILQYLFYAICFSFFVTFDGWIGSLNISQSTFISGTHVCPPYFQSCGNLYFLQALPYGYSQSFLYVGLYLLLILGVYRALNKDWVTAHMVLLICLLWKIVYGFFLTYGLLGNFDYYDMVLAFIWLFVVNKEYFAKITFVYFYFLASTIKIHEGWIMGNYFNSLYTGAPIFPSSSVPVFTNILIIMQMLGAFLLFSKNRFLYWFAFIYFLLFHIYSGIIVHYRYITISIPALLILFGLGKDFGSKQNQNFKVLPVGKKTILGYLILLVLTTGQFVAIAIPGDQKKTLEGNYYGLYMFEANHQCYSRTEIFYKNSTTTKVSIKENKVANNRCDPYRYYFPIKTLCERDDNISNISWQFDHSINGNPFERLVDTGDVCSLTPYKTFSHNGWIKIGDEPQTMDFPVYKTGYIAPMDPSIQVAAEPLKNKEFLDIMTKIYWFIWVFTFLFLISLIFKANIRK